MKTRILKHVNSSEGKGMGEKKIGLTGDVELGVICIEMKSDFIFPENVAERNSTREI